MVPRRSITTVIRSLWVSKPTLNVRFPPALLKDMEVLVDSGKYSSLSEIVIRGVTELVYAEKMESIIDERISQVIQREKER